MNLTTYHASDRRCYYGAPCSDLRREIDHTDALYERMRQANMGATCTYFPAEGKYMTFLNFRAITGNFHDNEQEALIEAIQKLEGDNEPC